MNNAKLQTLLEILVRAGKSLLLGVVAPISIPFLLVFWPLKYIYKHSYALLRGIHYDDRTDEYISNAEYKNKKEEARKRKRKERIRKEIEEGKLKTTDLPHVTKHPFRSFLCVRDNKDNLPNDAVAYIASEPDEKIRDFFNSEADWIARLSAKYGIDFIQADYEKVRSIMLFPQDFKEMRHGIIWRSNASTSENEYGLFGRKYFYFELNSESKKPLKQQLEDVMINIYDCLLNYSLLAI